MALQLSQLKGGFSTYKRLIRVARAYWWLFIVGMLATIALSSLDAAFTWLIKPIINLGFIHRDEHFIRWLPVIILAIFIGRAISAFLSNYCTNCVARNVVMDFRRKLFDHMLCLPAKFYDKNSSGYLLSTIIYNVEQVAEASSDSLVTASREFSMTIALVVVMFINSWRLSCLFLIVTPLIAWVVKNVSQRLRRLSSSVQDSIGEVTHIAEEGIEGYKVIRLFGGENYEKQKFHRITETNRRRELKIVVTNSIGGSVVQFIIAIPIAASLLLATLPTFNVSAGSFASIVAAMISLLRPVRRLTMVNTAIQKGIAGAESLFKLLDEAPEEDKGTLPLARAKGEISYQDVSFRYDSTLDCVLKDIQFTLHAGQTLAIVGKSGGGKSTLVSLLPRFYDPCAGKIVLDGVDLRDYKLADLRKQIAFVSQHTVLFNDTIAHNIAYSQEREFSLEEIYAAARAANAYDFIMALPQGFETRIGENGLILSGGQRQRIAIARALLKNAPILILDEATSALDTESERAIQAALDQLMKTRTTLVIAHRLSTIENADWILVMDEGRIVEMGTHQDLLVKNQHYARLHKMQFRQVEEQVEGNSHHAQIVA